MLILLKKFISLTKILFSNFLIVFFSPLSLLIVIISPFYLIRLGFISSSRVGTLLYVSEIFLAEKLDKINERNKIGIDIFHFDKIISNELIAKKIEDELLILDRKLINPIYKFFVFFSSYFKFLKKHIIKNHNYFRDVKYLIEKYSPIIKLTLEEIKLAKKILEENNIYPNKIAVYMIRDSDYLDKVLPDGKGQWINESLRDDNINSYLKSMKFLTSKGYTVFRMGKYMKNKLDTNDPKIIDYAFKNFRSELLDFYLMSKCDICVTTHTGIDVISDLHHRPTAMIPYPLSWIPSQRPNVLFMPKKIYNFKSKKVLSLLEIFNYMIIGERNPQNLYIKNLKVLPSDEEEIFNLVREIYLRLEGVILENTKDLENQKKFWSIFFEKIKNTTEFVHHDGSYKAKISSTFLRSNEYFLN